MKKSRLHWYFILPLVYAGLFIGLGYMQFSATESETLRLGPFEFIGNRGSLEAEAGFSGLQVFAGGARFSFTSERALTIGEGRFTNDVSIRGVRRQSSSIRVDFQRDVSLDFQAQEEGWIMQTDLGEQEISPVVIPLLLGEGAQVPYQGVPVIQFDQESEPLVLLLPPGSFYNESAREVVLNPLQGAIPALEFRRMPENRDAFDYWVFGQSDPRDEAEYLQISEDYWDQAFDGWKTGRWSSSRQDWSMPRGNRDFSSPVVRAFLADSHLRGEYLINFDRIDGGWNTHLADRSLLINPYFGDILQTTVSYRNQLEARFADSPEEFPASFTDWELGQMAIHWPTANPSSPLVRQGWRDRLLGDPDWDWAPRELAGFFLGQIQTASALERSFASGYWENVVQRLVFPRVGKVRNGLLVQDNEGFWDLKLSLMVSGLLKRIANYSSSYPYLRLSQEIELGAYQLAGDYGYLPEILVPSGQEFLENGNVGPEEFYSLVRDNSLYPSMRPLNPDLFPGGFLYSSAEIEDVRVSPSQILIQFEHPVGRTHYFIVGNLPSIDSLELHGIDWRSDPNFDIYTDGYFFSNHTNTLYMKITHRQRLDGIIVRF